MDRLGIIGGSAFLAGEAPAGSTPATVHTAEGPVRVDRGAGYVFIRRHGHGIYHPPHRIPHRAHALALERLGVRRAVGLCSVGALDPSLEPGSVVIPDDYLSFHPPPTFARDERLHIVPVLDPGLRSLLADAARSAGAPVREGGVYAETRGPRFETRAEIRLLADYAHVVGMTAASEATLLQERGIACAVLGIVDNYANGIGAEPLTLEAFDRQLAANGERARSILAALIEHASTQTGGGDGG